MTLAGLGRFINKQFLLLSTALFVLSIVVDVEIGLIYDLFCLISFIAMPYNAVIEKIFFLLPLTACFEFAHVWLMTLAVLILKKGRISVLSFVLIVFFWFLEWLAHFTYGVSIVNRMLGYLTTISIMIYLIYEMKDGIDFYECLKKYIRGLALIFVLYFLNAFKLKGASFVMDIMSGVERFGGTAGDYFEEMKIGINANTLAYYSICGVSVVFVLNKFKVHSRKEAFLLWSCFSLFLLVGAMTISRTWILLLFMLVILYLFTFSGDAKKYVGRLCGILFITLIAIWYLSTQTSLLDAFLRRFQTERIESAGGRTLSTTMYLKTLFSNGRFLLMGTGVADYHWVIGIGESIHNGLTQIMVCCGIPGAIIMLLVLFAPLLQARRKRVELVFWLPVMFVFLFTQTIQFLNPVSLMLPHIVGIYALELGKEIR